MAAYYMDSSALVKRYVQEAGSEWVSGLLNPEQKATLYATPITMVEVVAAIARRSVQVLSVIETANLVQQFKDEFSAVFEIVELNHSLIDRAVSFAEEHRLRGYDAIQLAAAFEVNSMRTSQNATPITLVSADAELSRAAADIGLAVDNPNQH